MSRPVAGADEDVDFPPLLERVLRFLLGTAWLLAVLLPLAASAESLVQPGLPVLDAGASTPCARAVLNCLVLMATIFLLLLPSHAPEGDGRRRWPTRLLAAFLGIWLAASLASVCVADSLQSAMAWGVAGLFFLVSREVASTRRAFELALHCLLAVGALVAIVSVRIWLTSPTDDAAVTGAFYQADVAAGFFLLLGPVAVALLVGSERGDQRIFYGGLSLLFLACLVLTYSRAGQIAGVGALLLVLVMMWPARRMVAVVTVVSVAVLSFVLAGLVSSGGSSVIPRKTLHRAAELAAAALEAQAAKPAAAAGQVADTSVTARVNFYRGGWRMALARPALGWGPATFGRVFPRYQDDVRFYSKYAHSAYITILAESGFVGAAAFAAFLVALAVGLWLQYRRARTAGLLETAAVVGLVGGLAAAAAHVVVDVDWEFQMLLVMFMGLAGLCSSEGAVGGASAPAPVSHRRMLGRWLLCLPVMGLIALQPFPFVAHFADAAAVVARQSGNLDAAIASQRQAVAYMPFNSNEWRQLAEFLLTKADEKPSVGATLVDEARQAAARAVSLDPCRAVNRDLLARALLAAGDRTGAELEERQAIVCDPVNYPKFYNVVSQILTQRGEDAQALDLLKSIAGRYAPEMFQTMWYFRRDTIKEQLSQTWFLIGTLDQKGGRAHDARHDFEQAVEMNGASIAARFQLGMVDLNEGRPGQAFEQFLAIQRLKARSPVTRWLLGMCYRQMGQYSRATQLLEAAYKEMPSLRNAAGQTQIPPDFFVPDQAPPVSPLEPVSREPQA